MGLKAAMKRPSVAHACPTGVAEAAAPNVEHGKDARPPAGGQILRPPPNIRLTWASPPLVRFYPLPFVVAAALSLAACQGSGAGLLLGGGERPELAHAESVSTDDDGSEGESSAPITGGGTTTIGGSTVQTGDVSSGASTAEELTKSGVGQSENGGELQGGRSSSESSVVLGTEAGGVRLAERPRNNPTAADLLDYWGHRQTHQVVSGLSLIEPADGDDATDLRRLQEAAWTNDEVAVAPDLRDGDDVRVLGARRGVTYGRWTGGAADTLSIRFDLSQASWQVRNDPAFRALVERAGKAWSHRIADTWSTWERRAGEFKGWRINGTDPDTQVYVGPGGEVSTGLQIELRDDDLPEGVAGWAQPGSQPPGDLWEPRYAPLEIDSDYLQEQLRGNGKSALFRTLTHEMGHVLGAWQGGATTERYAPYTDTEAGTWTGPNVTALRGGPAPFQDAVNTHDWVDGERDPEATEFDFAHSGLCASVMAYCGFEEALTAFLPQAIDFAFLADLGMTIAEETDRPETYGLAGWTDYAAFTLAVSRDLRMTLADSQPHYDGAANRWRTLDVTDLLRVGVDAFGYRSTGDLGMSYPMDGSMGKVCYVGGLIGAAIDVDSMPPVTGDAKLAIDLDSLDGTASFTSLEVNSDRTPETFADGALYYPLAIADNSIRGTEAHSTLSADFYGPGHEDVAGTLHDPRVGLLASFGATHDDRPDREDLIDAATYLTGRTYQSGASDPTHDGWTDYRCLAGSTCETNEFRSDSWSGWTAASREAVLAATTGWDRRDTAILAADHDFLRVERQTAATTDGRQGRHVVDGYFGIMEHGAFGVGFEKYSNGWTDSVATPGGLFRRWNGAQGTMSSQPPDARAHWSGLMLGYQGRHDALDDPFVEGVATVDFYLATNRVDVAFSNVASRDGQRALPDISFRGLEPRADGTLQGNYDNGWLRGAFLGPGHEEAVGIFSHSETTVRGSFGAQAVPDTVTLQETGTTSFAGDYSDSSGTRSIYAYDDWGFWGRQFGTNVFTAVVDQEITRIGNTSSYGTPTMRVSGPRSGSNPVSGRAVWLGGVRAFETGVEGHLPVSGSARLEVDFSDATVDVDFTDFNGGHGDLSWQGLQMTAGSFRDAQSQPTIEGAFYGTNHQGVAGNFEGDNLRGVFGATRN